MFKKLTIGAVSGALLLGVSAASTAQEADTCEDGRILFETVAAINVNGNSCLVYDVVVEGDVTVRNALQFEISSSDVGGDIDIKGTGDSDTSDSATVLAVDVLAGDVSVTDYPSALVVGSALRDGDLVVTDNLAAAVVRNRVTGDIECDNVETEARGNQASGVDACPTTQ